MKRFVFITPLILLLLLFVILVIRKQRLAADVFPSEQLAFDGTTRNYRLVIPDALAKPAPIVFAFHGIGDSPQSMAETTGLDRLASRGGFILVYPEARDSMWSTVEIDLENLDANQDVQFFDRLLAHLSERFDVDRNRVYLMGMSNGATFIQLLAICRSDEIAAIVAHSGPKPHDVGSSENSVPIMLVVGEDDSALSSMRSDAENYREAGHSIEFVSVPGLAHEWSAVHNSRMWEFLSQHALKSQ